MSAEIDKHVRALLDLGVTNVILDYHDEAEVFILPAVIDEPSDGDDERQFPLLEYQVSDGLPGQRSESEDFETYAEAQEAFERMVRERGYEP